MNIRRFLIAAAILGAACGSPDRSTSPTLPTAEDTAPAVVASPGYTVNAAPVPEDEKIATISPTGAVTITKERVWTACVYTYKDFQFQSFSHSYTVTGPGTTPFQPGPLCGTVEIQLDVQAGTVCPADPFKGPFDGFRAGRAGFSITNPCPTPTPPPPTPKCKPWYPGTPPQGGARITFMSKTTSGLYLWRLQNGTENDTLTVKGPGFNKTFAVPENSVVAFTTTSPYYGLSVYDCKGSKLHGTASANENTENWCSWPEAKETTCHVEEAAYCYYTPDCGNQYGFGASTACPETTKRDLCLALPSVLSPAWSNWNGQSNHCRTTLPGVAQGNFQLVPGKSHKDCLSKHDED